MLMTTAVVRDIVRCLDQDTPLHLAESWDNVGLQVGDGDWPVERIWVALDCGRTVVEAAAASGVHMLITHHPLLLEGVKRFDLATPLGYILEKSLAHRLAIYAAHTNLDCVPGGVNDALARRLQLQDPRVLDAFPGEEKRGFTRIGALQGTWTLASYTESLKERLGLSHIRFSGDSRMEIHQVACCAGSGSAFMDTFLSSDAQVFVSGDLKYHDARKAQEHGRGLIDIGHFHSEYLFLDIWTDRLRRAFARNRMHVSIDPCPVEKDPFVVL